MYVDYTSFQKLIATPKLELNFKRVAWVKIKKLSCPHQAGIYRKKRYNSTRSSALQGS